MDYDEEEKEENKEEEEKEEEEEEGMGGGGDVVKDQLENLHVMQRWTRFVHQKDLFSEYNHL